MAGLKWLAAPAATSTMVEETKLRSAAFPHPGPRR
jgi:hypothetical protein